MVTNSNYQFKLFCLLCFTLPLTLFGNDDPLKDYLKQQKANFQIIQNELYNKYSIGNFDISDSIVSGFKDTILNSLVLDFKRKRAAG